MKTDNNQSKNGGSPAFDENSSRLLSMGQIPNYWLWEVDANGIYTYCSPTVFDMLGYTPYEILGKRLFDIIVPEERDKLITHFGQIIKNPESVIRLENKSLHKNGSVIYIETNGVPYYNSTGDLLGYRGINQDLTRLKAAEKALVESESRLEHATDLAKLGIWEFDPVRNGFILDDWFYSFLGTSAKKLGPFMPIEDFRNKFIHPDDRDSSLEMIRKAQISGESSLSVEHRTICYNGEVRNILARFVFQKDENGISRLKYGVNQDITSLKKAEIELRELNAAKDKFFSILAHDLRGPLSTFVGLTEVLFDDFLTIDKVVAMDIIKSMKMSATNIYRLLENLLEWSKVMRNRVEFTPEKFNLKNNIETCAGILSEISVKKRIEIEISIPDDMEVVADKHMFESIIRNLVSNAIKFTPVGGKVKIRTNHESNQYIRISISDTGIGIPPELKSKLFNLNEMTSRAGTEGESSSGLGLLLVKEFIEKHDGEIFVDSEVGKGTTFSFVIPQSDKKSLS